jgi:hypothetical protein
MHSMRELLNQEPCQCYEPFAVYCLLPRFASPPFSADASSFPRATVTDTAAMSGVADGTANVAAS